MKPVAWRRAVKPLGEATSRRPLQPHERELIVKQLAAALVAAWRAEEEERENGDAPPRA